MKKNIVLGLLFVMYSGVSFAYDGSKCMGALKKGGSWGWLTSSSQFLSSWGQCSMIGLAPQERPKFFVAQNVDKLIIDSAKGEGEYLASFSKLASCDAYTSQKLPDRLQNNLKQIYGDDLQNDAQEVYKRISELVRADKELSCKYLG
ncbi:MAG: hypothetical protein ACJAT2_001575 [Bacteriovoracaceae bacterium]|jgi:hypothetical protein